MASRFLRIAAISLCGGLAAILVCAGYFFGRRRFFPGVDDVQDFGPIETLLLAVAAGCLAGMVVDCLTRWSYRRRLKFVQRLTAELRAKPDQRSLVENRRRIEQTDVMGVWRELEALADCYRSALNGLVDAQSRLDTLRTSLGRGDPDQADRAGAVGQNHIAVGSSRQRMVARLAPNLHFIAATLPLRQFLGQESGDLPAHSFLDAVHPDDAPGLRRSLKEALKDGEGHNITFRVMLGSESEVDPSRGSVSSMEPHPARERFLQMDVMTWYDDTGTPLHLRCHFLDITDRVQTERELLRITREVSDANARLRQTNEDLQRLKESYRDLYHYAPVLYFSLDAKGNLVAFNETMLRTLGYPRETLHNEPYENLLTPGGKGRYRADPAVMQRPGEVKTQWVKQDGTVIDVWIDTTTIRDADNSFIRSRSAARDVTENRRLDDARQRKAEEASQANIQLRRINQELEEFTYVVSHDLKEPLRTLEAFSNFLAHDYGPLLEGDGKEYISHLVQASRRLGRLIDDLLTLSRTGRVIHTPRAFPWEPVLATVRSDLHDLIQRKQAVVRVEGELPAVIGDPERVIQLVANLVSNGLKYNNNPQPEVVIGARPNSACPPGSSRHLGDNFVMLFFRDNGIGIDPAYHEQIFRIFRRLHRRDEIEGTGAGLAICKRIVEAHGGRIWVESRVGNGATFLITLPREVPNPRRGGGEEVAGFFSRDASETGMSERPEANHDEPSLAARGR